MGCRQRLQIAFFVGDQARVRFEHGREAHLAHLVLRQHGTIDLDALRRDVEEVWAEAVGAYRSGESWWLDTEAEPVLAGRFHIRSIPTLVLFAGGRGIARQSGALPLQAIVEFARQVL